MFAKRPMIRLVFTSFMLLSLFFTSLGITPAYAAGITVNTAVDESTTNGLCSLREAIINANSNGAIYPDCATGFGIDTITFAGNYTITLAGAELPMVVSEIIVKGNGAANTIIQANANPNTATHRVFNVSGVGKLTLDSLTVRHGRCIVGTAVMGGGIHVGSGSTLTVTNSTISGNYALVGGGIYNDGGFVTITNSTISGNTSVGGVLSPEGQGAGIFNSRLLTITNSIISGNHGNGLYNATASALTLTNSIISGNSSINGSGIYNANNASLSINESTFSTNYSTAQGGAIFNAGTLSMSNSTFSGNGAEFYGGAVFNSQGTATVTDSTFSGNTATNNGGGIYNSSTAGLGINRSTFYGNSAAIGGALHNEGNMQLANTTISGNEAYDYGGGIYSDGSARIYNSTIVFNTLVEGTNLGAGGIDGNVALYNSIVAGNTRLLTSEYRDCSGTMYLAGLNAFWNTTNCSTDPASPGYSTSLSSLNELGPLQDNGGPTWTHALLSIEGESRAIDAGDNAVCASSPINNLDQRGVTRPQGSRCDIGAYEAGGIKVIIGNAELSAHALAPTESTRVSLPGVNNGPVQLINRNGQPLIAAERVIYKVNGVPTSFTEMMGLPDGQLSTTYWLPWYNNVDLDTQLRFGNVSGSTATVRVYIGGTERTSGCTSTPSLPYPYVLGNGASIRVSCAGVNIGPVKIQSTGNIVAAERVIYKVNGVNTSFTEMMALPNSQLNTTYWLPWYNNVDLDTQLRFGNVSGSTATVRVYIGGREMQGSPFILPPGASLRQSFAGVKNGPVKIVSDQNIVAGERVIYKVNGVPTSYSEVVALSNSQLNTIHWFPWYNNKDLSTQLLIGNAGNASATVRVYIGGTEVAGSPFSLAANASLLKSFPNINNGPVKIVSNVNIVASEQIIYRINGVNTSFSEMMGLPNSQLSTTYWLPWYNNVDLDTQLRFGVP